MTNILTIVIAIASASGFWGLLQALFEKKAEARHVQLDEVMSTVREIERKLDANEEVTVSYARDRLNYLSNKYLDYGYIPKKDYVPFMMLGETYCKYHNSEVALRFEQCKELPQK